MNREDELQGIIDFQAKEIKELKAVLKKIAKGKYSTEGHSGWYLAEQALEG